MTYHDTPITKHDVEIALMSRSITGLLDDEAWERLCTVGLLMSAGFWCQTPKIDLNKKVDHIMVGECR